MPVQMAGTGLPRDYMEHILSLSRCKWKMSHDPLSLDSILGREHGTSPGLEFCALLKLPWGFPRLCKVIFLAGHLCFSCKVLTNLDSFVQG